MPAAARRTKDWGIRMLGVYDDEGSFCWYTPYCWQQRHAIWPVAVLAGDSLPGHCCCSLLRFGSRSSLVGGTATLTMPRHPTSSSVPPGGCCSAGEQIPQNCVRLLLPRWRRGTRCGGLRQQGGALPGGTIGLGFLFCGLLAGPDRGGFTACC